MITKSKMKNIQYIIISLFICITLTCCKKHTTWPESFYSYAENCKNNGEYEKAIYYFEKTIQNSHYSKDSCKYYISALLGECETLIKLHCIDLASEKTRIYHQYAISKDLMYEEMQSYILFTKISIKNRDFKKGSFYLQKVDSISTKYNFKTNINDESEIINLALDLENNKSLDLCKYDRLKEMAIDTNFYYMYEALKIFSLYEAIKNNNKSFIQAINMTDSINSNRLVSLSKLSSYNKSQYDERNKIKNNKKNIYIGYSWIITIAILVSTCYDIMRKRKKHYIKSLRNTIKKDRTIIYQLNNNLAMTKKEVVKEKNNLRKNMLYNMNIGKLLPIEESCNNLNTSIYENLFVKEEHIMKFMMEIKFCFPDFYDKLDDMVKANIIIPIEAFYCCLFALNIRTKDIAKMLSVQTNTISSRKKRIKEKIDNNSSINFESLIDYIK